MDIASAVIALFGVALTVFLKLYSVREAKKPERHVEENDDEIRKVVVDGDRLALAVKLKQLYDKARRSRGPRG